MSETANNEEAPVTAEQKAWDELARLTSGSGRASNWRWSTPANPDRDSDLILAAGFEAVAGERDALAGRLAEAQAIIAGVGRVVAPQWRSSSVYDRNALIDDIRVVFAKLTTDTESEGHD